MLILKLKQKNFKKVIKKVVKFIQNGKVIICPTDTVYGLICDAENKAAVRKIFKIKKRSFQKPVSLFVEDLATAQKVAVIEQNQEKILNKLWPGKLIAVLKAKRKFPKGIACQWGKIGLRIPNYKLLNVLLKKFKNPFAQTSANISGEPASTKIKDVLEQFENQKIKPDLVIDAGNLKLSKSSKVIDLTKEKPKILRK